MVTIVHAKVCSVSFSKCGQWCFIKFWPRENNNVKDDFWLYSILPSSQIYAFGGVPNACELSLLENEPDESKYFSISISNQIIKPALFVGMSYQSKGIMFMQFRGNEKKSPKDIAGGIEQLLNENNRLKNLL